MAPPQTAQSQSQIRLPIRLKKAKLLSNYRHSRRPATKSKTKTNLKPIAMCSTVRFVYRCGCSHTTTFECPGLGDTCWGTQTPTTTALDEDCHDCAQTGQGAEEDPPENTPLAPLAEEDRNAVPPLSSSAGTAGSETGGQGDADADADITQDTTVSFPPPSPLFPPRAPLSVLSPVTMFALRERDPNLPTKPSPMAVLDLDLDLDLDLHMQLMDLPSPRTAFWPEL
ncbi:hypothetical protein F5Y11DRAFT_349770 [Daldinia sp. FL1419]|nr:hypothetical protein F5Y11DRAFT_349770 [Daldinia sp. FL1419]